MKRLVLTEIARADLASIRRFSTRSWGRDQTSRYIDALRDTMKGLVRGTVMHERVVRTTGGPVEVGRPLLLQTEKRVLNAGHEKAERYVEALGLPPVSPVRNRR